MARAGARASRARARSMKTFYKRNPLAIVAENQSLGFRGKPMGNLNALYATCDASVTRPNIGVTIHKHSYSGFNFNIK